MEKLIDVVHDLISKAKQGLNSESTKEDLKKEWYPLATEQGINEFCKDLSSIANTVGPTGLILIGVDEKSGEITDSPLNKSGLQDESRLFDLMIKRIDPPIDFQISNLVVDGKTVTAIRVPPSSKKPHVIREYTTFKNGEVYRKEQNRIYVRKNTQSYPANKYDLDLMYYDRGNASPDYDLSVSLRMKFMIGKKRNNPGDPFKISRVDFSGNFIFENVGRRPVYVDDLKFKFEHPDYQPGEIIFFGFDKAKEIVVNPNEIKRHHIVLNENNVRENSLNIFDKPELMWGSDFSGVTKPAIEIILANESKMVFPVKVLGWIKENVAKVF